MVPPVNTELAASIRRVNAHFMRIPEGRRPEVDTDAWQTLEDEIDTHCARGDRDLALAAIEAWEAHALRALGVEVS